MSLYIEIGFSRPGRYGFCEKVPQEAGFNREIGSPVKVRPPELIVCCVPLTLGRLGRLSTVFGLDDRASPRGQQRGLNGLGLAFFEKQSLLDGNTR